MSVFTVAGAYANQSNTDPCSRRHQMCFSAIANSAVSTRHDSNTDKGNWPRRIGQICTFVVRKAHQKRGFRGSIVMLGRRSCCGFLKTRKGFSAAESRSHDFFGFFPFFPIFCDFFRFFLKEIKRIFEIIEVPGRGSPGTSREPPGEPRAYPGDEVPGSFQSKRKEQINFFLLF